MKLSLSPPPSFLSSPPSLPSPPSFSSLTSLLPLPPFPLFPHLPSSFLSFHPSLPSPPFPPSFLFSPSSFPPLPPFPLSLRDLSSGHHEDQTTGARSEDGRALSVLQIPWHAACPDEDLSGGGSEGTLQGVSRLLSLWYNQFHLSFATPEFLYPCCKLIFLFLQHCSGTVETSLLWDAQNWPISLHQESIRLQPQR